MATLTLITTEKSVEGNLGKSTSEVDDFSCTVGIHASHYRVLPMIVFCLLC